MEAWSLRQRKKKKEEKWGSVAGRVADRSNKNSSCLEPKELYLGFYSLQLPRNLLRRKPLKCRPDQSSSDLRVKGDSADGRDGWDSWRHRDHVYGDRRAAGQHVNLPVLRPVSYYPSLVATESCFRYSTIDWSIGKGNPGMKDFVLSSGHLLCCHYCLSIWIASKLSFELHLREF